MTHSKNFFSENRVRKFTEQLASNGAENITISAFRDGFGQTQYTVKWYLD